MALNSAASITAVILGSSYARVRNNIMELGKAKNQVIPTTNSKQSEKTISVLAPYLDLLKPSYNRCLPLKLLIAFNSLTFIKTC